MSGRPGAERLVRGAATPYAIRERAPVLLRVAPVAWGLAVIAVVVLLFYAIGGGEEVPLEFTAIVMFGCGVLWVFPASGRQERRALLSLFLFAFAVRLGSAVLFDSLARAAGDPLFFRSSV